METTFTRRDAIRAAAVAGGALALGGLTGCSGSTGLQKINEGNDEVIKGLDLANDVLPIGSVVELDGGRYMITRDCVFVRSTGSDGGVATVYDYYGCVWPAGLLSSEVESYCSAAFNAADIKKVLFVGYADDESKDFRDYIKGYDPVSNDPSRYTKGTSAKYLTAGSRLEKEQKYRLEGKRSEELYGSADNKFHGGLIYSDVTVG